MVEVTRRAPEGLEVQVDGGAALFFLLSVFAAFKARKRSREPQRRSAFRRAAKEKDFVQRVKKSFFQGTGGCARPIGEDWK